VLHQRGRVGLVLGALDEPDARQVRVRAGPVLVGPGGRDREVRIVRELARQVVVVGEPDVAAPGRDRVEHVDVGAQDLRLVGHPGLEQRAGLVRPPLGDHVRHERLVVLVVGRAQAELALPARVAEILVAADRVLGDARVAHRGADPQAQPPPVAVGVAELLRNLALQRFGAHRREQPGLLGAPQVREVGRDQEVGGRAVALAAQALEQLRRRAAAQLQLLAALVLPGRERRLVAVLRAAVVDDDVGGAAEREDGGAEQEGEEHGGAHDGAAAASKESGEHGELG
jgi:hypothetical protein